MPSADRRSLGAFGEAAAAAHLTQRGYLILARNWRCRAGEIDLIAQERDQVVFVEVRTRRGGGRGSPEESVTRAKQARLIELAYSYLAAHDTPATTLWRIDVIAVELDRAGRIARLNHIHNAVEEH